MATVNVSNSLVHSTGAYCLSAGCGGSHVLMHTDYVCIPTLCTSGTANFNNLTVAGNLTVQGTTTTLNTTTCTTSAMSITNAGTGPALVVNQTGSQPILDFQDDGTSSLYIEDGGNVGVGTTNPGSRLSVNGVYGINIRPGTSGTCGSSTAVNNLLQLTMPYGSSAASCANAGARVGLVMHGSLTDPITTGAATKTAAIYGVSEDTGAGYSRKMGMALYTSSFDAAAAERVRIDADGKVGIGSTDPDYQLDVVGCSRASERVYIGTGGGYFYNDSGSRVRINQDFYTNNGTTYIYGDNTYLGANSANDVIHTRDNEFRTRCIKAYSSCGLQFWDDSTTEYMRLWDGGTVSTGDSAGAFQLTNNSLSKNYYDNHPGAYYHAPSMIIRKDSSCTALCGVPASLVLYNNNGTNNTGTKLVFASREVAGAGNPVATAAIISRKVGGQSGNWACGDLAIMTKNRCEYCPAMCFDRLGRSYFQQDCTDWVGSNTYLRSSNEFAFLDGSNAQNARFKGIQVSDSYNGTVPNCGILFGADTCLLRAGAGELTLCNSGSCSIRLNIRATNSGNAIVQAGNSIDGNQGTGAFEVTQDGLHGGGMSYNGDASPTFVSGETADHVTFYNLNNGTRTEVFHYAYNSTTVNFNATPTVGGCSVWHSGNDGSGSGLDADLLDGQHGTYYLCRVAPQSFNSTSCDLNCISSNQGWYNWSSQPPANNPGQYGFLLHICDSSQAQQLVQTYGGAANKVRLFGRRKTNGNWDTCWTEYWSNANHGSGSGLNADLLDGIHSSGFLLCTGMPNNTDTWLNFRVIRNANSGGCNDGMYIGYSNTNSGLTRLYGGGSTSCHSMVCSNGLLYHSSGNRYIYQGDQDVMMRRGTITSENWNNYIDGTEASYYQVNNHSGSNRPAGSYTYGTVINFSSASAGKFQLYAPHNGSEGCSLWYRTGWNTDYDAWAKIWDTQNDGSGSGLDADLLDNLHASSFLRSDVNDTTSCDLTIGGKLCLTAASTSLGNIKFSAANPYICASSYIIMPGGLYVNGGTAYFSNGTKHRGGISNDSGAWLCITGGTAGDTSFGGQVGIGTTDPGSPLEICNSIASGVVCTQLTLRTYNPDFIGACGGNGILFKNQDSNNSTNEGCILAITRNDDCFGDNDEANTSFVFRMTNGGTAQDNVIFTGDGRVGIGTTNPSSALTVAGDARLGDGNKLYLYTSNSVNWLAYNKWQVTTSTALAINNDGTGGFQIQDSGSPVLFVGTDTTYGGRVGINTVTPSAMFSVCNGEIALGSSSSYTSHFNYQDSGTHYISMANSGCTYFRDSSGNTRMTIQGTGNVGIDTTSPDSKLSVGGTFTATTKKPTVAVVDVTNGGSLGIRGLSPILAFDITSSGTPKILMDNGGIEFKTGTLDAEGDVDFKIAADGNVGIGTTDPGSCKLQVQGTAKIVGKLHVTAAINLCNSNLCNANHITINDPGVGEGLSWNSTTGGWIIDVSPLNRSNADGNLNLYNSSSNNIALWRPQLWVYDASNYATGTANSDGSLTITSTNTGADIFSIEGSNGTLFSVADDLSDSLMSVNDAAGLPVLEVFADSSVCAGRYSCSDFYIASGGNIGMGTSAPTFAAVSGNTAKGLEIANVGNDTQASLRLRGHNNTGTPGVATYTELKHAGGNLEFQIDHNGTNAITVKSNSDVCATCDVCAYQYCGHSNIDGTGFAARFPCGFYSTGTSWLYSSTWMNNNSIMDLNEVDFYDQVKFCGTGNANELVLCGANATNIELILSTAGTTRGYLHANNSNEVGLLDSGGAWAIRHVNDTGTYFYDNGGTQRLCIGTGTSCFSTRIDILSNSSGATGGSAPNYGDAQIEITTSSNYTPAISFHRSGYSATTLHEYDGELYVSPWTTRTQQGKLISTGNLLTCIKAVDGSGSGLDADLIDGVNFRNTGSNTGINADTLNSNGIVYYNAGVTNFSGNSSDGALYAQIYSSSWQHQIAGDYRSGQIALRGKCNGTWQSWRKVWDESNDGSGSGLDADLLDGQHGSYYGLRDHFRSIGAFNLSCGTTTACVMAQLENNGIFDSYVGALKTSWSYAGNCDLTDAGRLTELAGTSWLTWTDNSSDSTRGHITALVIAPNTGGSANKAFIYNDQGGGYSPGWREIWTNASDGSGSGLDADLLDGVQGSSYLRSDANDSTTGRIQFSANNTNNWDDIATTSSSQGALEIYNNGAGNDAFMAFHSGGDYAVYFGLDADSNSLAVGGWSMGANKYKLWHQGNDGSGSGLDADLLDGQHGSYYQNASNLNAGTFPDLFSSTTRYNIGLIDGHNGSTRDKLRVWNSGTYSIGMQSAITFGSLNEYAMTFQMNDQNTRGFWWGDTGHTTAQGAMSLTTQGYLTVAERIRVGAGQSCTSGPSYQLQVDGCAYISSHVYMPAYVYHIGDTNTYYGFSGSDCWRVVTGGSERIKVGNSEFTVNESGLNSDFRVEAQCNGYMGNKAYAIYVDASAGAVGIGTSQPSYALEVNGTAFVTGTFSAGTKNFLIDHPTKENYMLRHGSLEGPENAVYVRGTTTSSSIELPDYWTGLVDEDSITATLTPRGKYLQLFLDRVEDNEIHVGGTEIGELYDYVVYGTRKDVEDLVVEFERPVGS